MFTHGRVRGVRVFELLALHNLITFIIVNRLSRCSVYASFSYAHGNITRPLENIFVQSNAPFSSPRHSPIFLSYRQKIQQQTAPLPRFLTHLRDPCARATTPLFSPDSIFARRCSTQQKSEPESSDESSRAGVEEAFDFRRHAACACRFDRAHRTGCGCRRRGCCCGWGR